MSLQGYLNSNVLATISESTTTNTLTSIDVYEPTMITALTGETVLIVHKGTGREYPVTLNGNLEPGSTKLRFTSTTFDTIIPEGSIVIQSNLTKWDTIFRDYTIVTHKLYETGNTHANTNLIDPQYPSNITVNAGTTWSDGDTLANSYINNSIFRSPHDGFKLERITWDVNTNARTGHDCKFSLWAKPITENGNTATDIELIDTFAITSQNDINYVHNRDIVYTGSYDNNICLIPTFTKIGRTSSADNFYATLTLLISTDPRQ